MNICVLGGTGYLGSHIIDALLSKYNDEVKIFCIYRKNSQSEKKFENINNVEYVVSDLIVLKELFLNQKFDCIINASCSYMKNVRIDDIVESNFIFPSRILSLAVEHYYGISSNFNHYKNNNNKSINNLRVISIGTGLPDNFNLYTFTKKQFNTLGNFFSNEYGLEFINIKLENYYGENEPKNRFLPSVIEKLKQNKDIELTQGEQLRDFIYVDDVINAILLMIELKNIPSYIDIPLGSGDAPSIKELIIYLKELLKSQSDLQFGKVPLRPNEPSTFADLAMYNMLGGKIQYNWKEGIKNMLENEGLL